MEKYDFTQDAVSKSVGKSRPAIANSLRLLNLPEEVLDMVRDGSLSSGHARAILSLEEPEQMVSLAKRVADEGLNVRAVEKLVKKSSEKQKEEKPADFVAKDKYFSEMQLALTTALGRKIAIEKGRKKSKLVIEFYDETDLKEIAQKLTGENQ